MVKLVTQNIDLEWVKKTALEYQISYEKIYDLYCKSGYDKKKVLDDLKITPEEQELPKIVIYFNGMLLKNKFYSFEVEENKKLLEMLEKNEFDKNIFESEFGNSERYVDLIVERNNGYYDDQTDSICESIHFEDNKRRRKMENNINTEEIPKSIILGANANINFKFIFKNEEYMMKVDSNLKIIDILNMFYIKYNIDVYLKLGEEILDSQESVIVLKNSMIEIYEVKR